MVIWDRKLVNIFNQKHHKKHIHYVNCMIKIYKYWKNNQLLIKLLNNNKNQENLILLWKNSINDSILY
jgi:hypothetical protein